VTVALSPTLSGWLMETNRKITHHYFRSFFELI
jgi:hypothetical protein